MPDYWSSIWDTIWWALTIFVFIAYLIALFSIISDLFRDRELGGVAKAIWLVCLVFLPFLTALAYLIFRGSGMAERTVRQQRAAQSAFDEYVRTVSGGPASEISSAKELLDQGAISQAEFDQIKQAVLG
ncbi:SHOCT domain-containing protein, partial [Nocardioides dubius]